MPGETSWVQQRRLVAVLRVSPDRRARSAVASRRSYQARSTLRHVAAVHRGEQVRPTRQRILVCSVDCGRRYIAERACLIGRDANVYRCSHHQVSLFG